MLRGKIWNRGLFLFVLVVALAEVVYGVECGSNPSDGCTVTWNTVFNSDDYNLPNGIQIISNGVHLDCNGSVLNGSGVGIYINNVNNVVVENCTLINYKIGISLCSSEYSLIKNNRLFNTSTGIYLFTPSYPLYPGGSSHNTITNNFLKKYPRRSGVNIGVNTGIELFSSDDYNYNSYNTIDNNIVSGYYLCFAITHRSSYNTFINNRVENCETGFFLTSNTDHNQLKKNYITNTSRGIGVFSSTNHNLFESNTLTQNKDAIQNKWGYDNIFSNNILVSNTNDGIHFYYTYKNPDTMNNNFICYNNNYDINEEDSNLGDENTCDKVYNWNDNGATGCTYPCPTPNCLDGFVNGDEIGIDCGGSCPNKDCCTNGYKDINLGESDVDCGSSCSACINGKNCNVDSDCQSNLCSRTYICETSETAHCSNKVKDFDETDIDCGGSCPKCSDGKSCLVDSDCESDYCNSNNICTVPSCSEGVINGEEEGVDCGGSCPVCEPKCIPLKINGNKENKIDLVFIPENDYEGNITLFLEHVKGKINNLSEVDTIKDYINDFNFYYSKEEADIVGKFINLPGFFDFYKKCSFTDSVVVLHTRELDDFTARISGNKYTAEGYYTKAFLHETGHGIFGLADQYNDSSCKTIYFQSEKHPNIWNSSQGCEEDGNETGKWDSSDCHKFTDCQDGWWKMSQFDENIMVWGDLSDLFDEASKLRINRIIEETQNGSRLAGHYGKNYENNGTPKSVVVTFNIKDDKITKIDEEMIEGYSPNHLADEWQFSIKVTLENNSIAEEYSIPDPRVVLVEQGGNYTTNYLDDINFTVIFPYYPDLKKLKVEDTTNSTVQIETDLSNATSNFCEEHPFDLDCPASLNISLIKGWNLVSLPLSMLNMSVSSVLKNINYEWIFSYDKKWFVPNDFNNNLGYWIFVDESQIWEITGPRLNTTLNFSNGLVGYPFLNSLNLSAYNFSENVSIFSYNSSSKEWLTYNSRREKNTLKSLQPGYGYFIKII